MRLDDVLIGDLGNAVVDARLVQAIILRDGRMAEWLEQRGVDAQAVESDFPGTAWS